MTKAAVTFAELFIVLALMFIIQTVINFGLYEEVGSGRSGSGLPVLETLQVKGRHMWYLRFSKPVTGPRETSEVSEVTVILQGGGAVQRYSVGGRVRGAVLADRRRGGKSRG